MAMGLSYDGLEAEVCAELSDLVYELPYRIRSRIGGIVEGALIVLRTIPHRNFRILVAANDDAVYFVFRGTVFKSLRSWQANLAFARKIWMNGKVHGGFLGLLNRANTVYKPILARRDNREKRIYFTGHSQGGAVAFLAAMDNTRSLGTSRDWVNYTFGQPRTGNKQFCRISETRLGERCSRIANSRDLVVGVPFVWQGYDHIRDFLHDGGGGTMSRRRQNAGAGWPLVTASVKDHDMANYLKSAKKNSWR